MSIKLIHISQMRTARCVSNLDWSLHTQSLCCNSNNHYFLTLLQLFMFSYFSVTIVSTLVTYVIILYKRRRGKSRTLDTREPIGRLSLRIWNFTDLERLQAVSEYELKTQGIASFCLIFIVCWMPQFLTYFLAYNRVNNFGGYVLVFLYPFNFSH